MQVLLKPSLETIFNPQANHEQASLLVTNKAKHHLDRILGAIDKSEHSKVTSTLALAI